MLKRTKHLVLMAVAGTGVFSSVTAAQELYVPYADISADQVRVQDLHPSFFFTEDELPAIRERSQSFAGYLFEQPRYLEKAKELLLAAVEQTEPENRQHWRSHFQGAHKYFEVQPD